MPNWSIARARFSSEFSSCETVFDIPGKAQEITKIEERMAAPGFWDNQETAQQVVIQLKSLKSAVEPLQAAAENADDLLGMVELIEEDESLAPEFVQELERLEEEGERLELRSFLSGPNDAAGAILTINARDGGTDANDWADMLLRMYIQWAQKNEYSVELLDRSENDEAGINNATIVIRGPMAYGYLKGESGIHRLVRISPFNADGKRQTSFAAVDVSPEISDEIDIEINESDVRVDIYRASGAGGQHVNKTSSAVRLTHMPTKTVVQCQNERSQHKNKAQAWKMLRSRMARLEEEKREAEQAQEYKDKARVGFGAQIRNYFLHPDQRVKDARTGFTESNFHVVLDGKLDGFLDSFLRWRAGAD